MLLGDLWTRGCRPPVGDVEKEVEISLFGCHQKQRSYQVQKCGAAVLPPAWCVKKSRLPLTPA